MSNIPEKRPSEQPDEAEAKKPHIEPRHDHFAKGIAPIKAEFIVENPDVPVEEKYINDDEAEGGDRQEEEGGKGGKNKKRRGQNKKRDLKQQHEEVRLCSSLLDPENPKECRFGQKIAVTHIMLKNIFHLNQKISRVIVRSIPLSDTVQLD